MAHLTADVAFISASMSQSPGEVAPTFTLTQRPSSPAAIVTQNVDHLTYTPPESVTFTIDENYTWTCEPLGVSRTLSASDGVVYQTTYIPSMIAYLQGAGYGKHLVFLSCSDRMAAQVDDLYDPDDYEVCVALSDAYPSNGHTVNGILEKIAEYANVSLTSYLPVCHVADPSLVYQRGQPFLQIMTSLLPAGGLYACQTWNDRIVVSLVTPTDQEPSLPWGCSSIVVEDADQISYDSVTITGGMYKPVATLALGRSPGKSASTEARSNTLLSETLPSETQEVQGALQTTTRSKTTRTDADGKFFALLDESETTDGPVYAADGAIVNQDTIETRQIAYTYDHNDPLTYAVPRLTKRITTLHGYYPMVYQGRVTVSPSTGETYYLSDEYEVLTRTELLAMDASDQPIILLTAVNTYQAPFQTETEEKTYITENTMSLDWPEGAEILDTVTITEPYVTVNTVTYRLTDPSDVLQQIASYCQTQSIEPPSSTESVPDTQRWTYGGVTTQAVEVQQKRVTFVSAQSFYYEEQRSSYDASARKMTRQRQGRHLNAKDVPSAPTQYRRVPLEATAGEWGDKTVYATSCTVPTNNPEDFEQWAGYFYYTLTHPRRTMTVTPTAFWLPIGARLMAGTVYGTSLTNQGGAETMSLTII